MTLTERARLVFGTDGATLKVVFSNGSRASVRPIGIDTPETYPQLECGGDQATVSMEEMIRPGDELGLYVDPSRHQVDRYGRLLRLRCTAGTSHPNKELKSGATESGHLLDVPARLGGQLSARRRVRRSSRWRRCRCRRAGLAGRGPCRRSRGVPRRGWRRRLPCRLSGAQAGRRGHG